MTAPLPPDEDQRLAALRRYAILDTPPEPAFDRISRLAARLLRVPIVLIALMDKERQWFKSAYGTDVRESSREVSFCAHAMLGDGIMVVPDATRDERFAQSPFVIAPPWLRFYAGAPLLSSDHFKLGTLCALDQTPRDFSPEERAILDDLAAMASSELEHRLAIRERNRQEVALTNLRSGVVVSDPNQPDNPIVFCNPAFLEMTGYAAEEVIGSNCRFLQGAETNPAAVEAMRSAIKNRETFHGVVNNYRKDGTAFCNELTVSPVFDEEGQVVNFVGLQSDITERQRITDELQASYEKLQKLEALKDDLTHMIVHDLRSPLMIVIGFMDLLHSHSAGKLSPDDLQLVEAAQSGALSLQNMITSLLDVNRLESGQMPLDRQPHDLAKIVKEVTDRFNVMAGDRTLTLALPGASELVLCDSDLIGRVITNLISNALKFTPARGEVRVGLATTDHHALVSITDSGPGVPAEFQAKIFEKWGQVESRRHQHSSGLGLTLCKLAVEAHGGRIGIESEPGKGSTFWFALPLT